MLLAAKQFLMSLALILQIIPKTANIVCGWCDLASDNFFAKYLEGRKDGKYRWVLIVDRAYGKDGETVLKSRDLPGRLPFDTEEVREFLESDLKIWRSVHPSR